MTTQVLPCGALIEQCGAATTDLKLVCPAFVDTAPALHPADEPWRNDYVEPFNSRIGDCLNIQ
ncbi:hypothetical protein [Mycobacterium avium]|jgi:hypothetical protein|uniref:hypothetical protein n=1 Tax=Mycobacterium avium TaxID=1764 RepID=UPI0012DA1C9F